MARTNWDIYLRIKKREEEIGDVHRVMTVCWSYMHHFIRATKVGLLQIVWVKISLKISNSPLFMRFL